MPKKPAPAYCIDSHPATGLKHVCAVCGRLSGVEVIVVIPCAPHRGPRYELPLCQHHRVELGQLMPKRRVFP